MIAAPAFGCPDEYSDRLGDGDFWRPYAELALNLSGLSAAGDLQSGFVGTYPTLLGDDLVIKMFGHFGDWRRSYRAELAANRTIAQDPRILAPRQIATGELFPDSDHNWPYLISERLDGSAWREARLSLSPEQRNGIAVEVGRQIRLVHHQAAADGIQVRDDHRVDQSEVMRRHRHWAESGRSGALSGRLIDQIPSYLDDYRVGSRCMVHADLTEDHIFVRDGKLIGVIDWGDAMITDPYYELGALHLGAFAADRQLLGSFLDGYGWTVDQTFVRHAMQVALMHDFDLFSAVSSLCAEADSLDDLADRLWRPG
jgi:aminoglycoside phosphotransferase